MSSHPVPSGRTAAALPIRQLGDPVLRTRCDPVTRFDAEFDELVDTMFASMYEAQGVGLAANQIGIGLAVFVMDCDGVVAVVANPTVVELHERTFAGPEGCLSVRGHTYPTERAVIATVEGQDQAGGPLRITGEGEVARCLQHETDHLNGKVYLDRLKGAVRRQARREIEIG